MISLLLCWGATAFGDPTATSTPTATATATTTATPTPLPPLTCVPTANLVCNVNNLNPTGPNYGGAAYPSQLYNYANAEQAGRDVEHGFLNFVYTGQNGSACLGTTAAGLTMTPGSCLGYNAGYRAADPNNGTIGFTSSITFSDSSHTWVAMDENTSGNNAGLPNFTRVTGTHYLIDTTDATQPSMPYDAQLLMYVTTSGGAITAVTDLRNQFALNITGYIPNPLVISELIANLIEPRYLNGTDTIGPFNGARSGEINAADFVGVGNKLDITVTTTANSAQVQCAGGDCGPAVAGQYIGIFNVANAPTAVSTPVVSGYSVTYGGRGVVDAVLNGTTTVTSASANFASTDAGKTVIGIGIPSSDYIASVTNSTTIVLNVAATTSSSPTSIFIGDYSIVDGTASTMNPACTVFNSGAHGTTDDVNNIQLSNQTAYEVNNSITFGGNTYTIYDINNGSDQTFVTPNLATDITGRQVTDAVLNGTTTVTSATGAFNSAADAGRPVLGTGIPAGATIASVTNSTTIVLSIAASISGSSMTLNFGSEPVTGANCTTTRKYQAFNLYAGNGTYGYWGPGSNVLTLSSSANALNTYNANLLFSTYDANAYATAWYCAEGSATLTLCGIQRMDTSTFNAQGHTSSYTYLNDPYLMSNVPFPFVQKMVTFHDFGVPYGTDFINGTALPTYTNGVWTGHIVSVSGGVITLSSTVPNTVTTKLVGDDGAAVMNAIDAAVIANGPFNDAFFTGVYFPANPYQIITPIVPPTATSGFRMYGDSGLGGANGLGAATHFINMVLGNDPIQIVNQNPYPSIENTLLDDVGGSTCGVGWDIDSPNIGGGPTTTGYFENNTVVGCSTAVRVANTNTQNVEFNTFIHNNFGRQSTGAFGIGGEFGMDIGPGSEWNSLDALVMDNHIAGQVGVRVSTGQDFFYNEMMVETGYAAFLVAANMGDPLLIYPARRMEHGSRYIWAPSYEGGGNQNISLHLEDLNVTGAQYFPDCAFIQIPSNGPVTLTNNKLLSVATNDDDIDANVCSNGIISSPPTSGALLYDGRSNLWDNIGPTANGDPFAQIRPQMGSPTTQLHYTDAYFSGGSLGNYGGSYTPLPQQTVPIAQTLTLDGACPFTLTSVRGSQSRSSNCSLATGGATMSFPIDVSLGNNWWEFDASFNGQMLCHMLGSNAQNLELKPTDYPAFVPEECTTIQNNPGTINFYFSGDNLVIQNNSNFSSATPFMVSFINGAAN